MNRLAASLFLVIAFGSAATTVSAQNTAEEPVDTVRVVLGDGTVAIGTIERQDEREVVLRTNSGVQMTIPRENVESITVLTGRMFFRTDPNQTRLFFGPTGRAVGKGRGYFAVYEIFVPFVAIGAGNIATLSGGISINPGSGRFAYVAPKFTVVETEQVQVAIGAFGMTLLGIDEDLTTAMVFAVSTFGGPNAALTGGAGLSAYPGALGETVLLMFGGEVQASNHVKFLSENYVFPGTDAGALISGGIRFFGDNLAADLGLFTVTSIIDDLAGLGFFPWVGFAYNFR